MDKAAAVPKGYKQTEVGMIPEDWEIKTLGEIVAYINGKAHEERIGEIGEYIVVNSKFISTAGQVKKFSKHCLSPASKGDVLMVMSDVPNGRAIAKCFIVEINDLYTVNQRICLLKPISVFWKLLFYKLDRNPFYLSFDDGVKQTKFTKRRCPGVSFSTSTHHSRRPVPFIVALNPEPRRR